MRTPKIVPFLGLLLLVLMACKLAEQATVLATETPIPSPTTAPTATTPPATNTPEPTVDTPATQTALAPTLPPTQPPPPLASPTETARPSQGNTAVLERLLEDGAIGRTSGEYYRISDFDESIAKLGYVTWWTTKYQAEEFVITANTAWQSASDKANWPEAGCGFIYSIVDDDNYFLTYLALDGFVRTDQRTRDTWKSLSNKKYGKVSIPNGDAKLTLAVYGKRINFYVNDQRVVTTNASSLASGDIALTVLSGTNKDFGTRCQLTDIDLWIFK